MKQIFMIFAVLVLLLLIGVPASAQVLLEDNFTATAGTQLNTIGWTTSSGLGTNNLAITSPGLTFTGYGPSGQGNAVTFAATGEDVYKTYSTVNSGSVYVSFIGNITSAQSSADYFIALSPSALQTNYYARLAIRASGTGYVVGIGKGSESRFYGTNVFSLNTTYLFVVKYKFNTAADTLDDALSVYVLPAGTNLTAEPATPELAYTNNAIRDAVDLKYVTLRQGSATAAPTLVLSGLRVSSSWTAAIQGTSTPTAAKLTFVVNTATVPDTVNASYNVVLVGSGTGSADTALTSWGSGKALTNIGGDYWKTTFNVNVGDTLKYKIRIGGGGWEKDLSDGFLQQGHRNYIVAPKDTTFPVQFWNNGQNPQPQYFRPWTTIPDSFISVYFRVNMQNVMNNGSFGWSPKDVDSVGVRGGGNDGDDLSWGQTFYLKQELPPGDGGGQFTIPPGTFFSGRLKFRKSAVHVGDSLQFKFLLGWNWGRDELQGGAPNRILRIPLGKADTTLQWVWFNNDKPILRANADTLNVTFNVDMTTAIQKQSFTIGDSISVQSGFFATADSTRTIYLVRQGLTNRYSGSSKLVSALNKFLDYQYYLHKGGNDIRENYFNFSYTGLVAAEQERRQVNVTTKTLTIKDTVLSVSDNRRQPYFANQRLLNKSVLVTWTVDMRPAYYQLKFGDSLAAIQGPRTVLKADSIKKWGVGFNGPAADPVGGGWGSWDNFLVADTNRYHKMWDDGTHGDAVANDSIYTIQITYTTANTIGQVFKFGIGGSDNESAFGLNHLENIDGTNPTATLNTQFGSINPNKYSHWDFTNQKPILTGVAVPLAGLPKAYSLDQNYPNPFNPSTVVRYSIPNDAVVTLRVFNIIGQQVATLIDQKQAAGNYSVTFDASKLSSGVYFYRINAGQFVSTKKMLLMK